MAREVDLVDEKGSRWAALVVAVCRTVAGGAVDKVVEGDTAVALEKYRNSHPYPSILLEKPWCTAPA